MNLKVTKKNNLQIFLKTFCEFRLKNLNITLVRLIQIARIQNRFKSSQVETK
jgi:hypothetical protein